jgi:hypothetical protein
MMLQDVLPPLPRISVDDQPVAMAFEWYKHMGLLAATAMRIHPDSAVCREVAPLPDWVLRGLLNRCVRLMLSTLRLTSTGKHGEAAQILARCITESAAVGLWLLAGNGNDRFRVYFADALRSELKARQIINDNVRNRGGAPWRIETRMVGFINRLLTTAGLTEQDVAVTPRLPNFKDLLQAIGFDDIAYVFLHRLGSQSVHGTWSDLVDHYLVVDTSPVSFDLRDNDVPAQAPLFVGPALLVNRLTSAFLRFRLGPSPERRSFLLRLHHVKRQLVAVIRAEDPTAYEPDGDT